MVINVSLKENKNFTQLKKKRINWSQTLNKSKNLPAIFANSKKSLQYVLLLKKITFIKGFRELPLLQAFISKYGKIKSRRKTRITPKIQRKISRLIKQARAFGLIPYTCDVKI